MSSLRRYLLYTSIFAAVATGCSTTDQNPPGQAGAAGSSVGSGGSTGTGGGFTAGTGELFASAPRSPRVSGTGAGGSGVAGTGGHAASGGVGGTGAGGDVSTGGGPGTGGTTSTGGSGGGAPAAGCGNAAAPKGARNLTIQVNGKSRTYVLFVPNGYDAIHSAHLRVALQRSLRCGVTEVLQVGACHG